MDCNAHHEEDSDEEDPPVKDIFREGPAHERRTGDYIPNYNEDSGGEDPDGDNKPPPRRESQKTTAGEPLVEEAEGYKLILSKSNATGYKSVTKRYRRGRVLYEARGSGSESQKILGTFDSAVEAAVAVAKSKAEDGSSDSASNDDSDDENEVVGNLDDTRVNRGEEKADANLVTESEGYKLHLSDWRSRGSATGYMGVRETVNGKYEAYTSRGGGYRSLGTHDSAVKAAVAVAKALAAAGKPPAQVVAAAAAEARNPPPPILLGNPSTHNGTANANDALGDAFTSGGQHSTGGPIHLPLDITISSSAVNLSQPVFTGKLIETSGEYERESKPWQRITIDKYRNETFNSMTAAVRHCLPKLSGANGWAHVYANVDGKDQCLKDLRGRLANATEDVLVKEYNGGVPMPLVRADNETGFFGVKACVKNGVKNGKYGVRATVDGKGSAHYGTYDSLIEASVAATKLAIDRYESGSNFQRKEIEAQVKNAAEAMGAAKNGAPAPAPAAGPSNKRPAAAAAAEKPAKTPATEAAKSRHTKEGLAAAAAAPQASAGKRLMPMQAEKPVEERSMTDLLEACGLAERYAVAFEEKGWDDLPFLLKMWRKGMIDDAELDKITVGLPVGHAYRFKMIFREWAGE